MELFLEFALLLLLSFTLLQTLYILRFYRVSSVSELQYRVEKKSYLITTVISVALIVKIALVAFFTYSLNELSLIVPGAMCGAGVLSSNEYGEIALSLKLLVLLLSSLWIMLHRADLYTTDSKYFKKKMWFFVAIYILVLVEFIVSIAFYSSIETLNPVMCCSAIYTESSGQNPIPFNMPKLELISLFYTLYIAVLVSAYRENKKLLLLFSVLFLYIAYYAAVYFFSAYIYEIPTHKCPFCMLQKEYYYVGYLIYSTLFLALFYTLSWILFEAKSSMLKKAIIYYTIFTATLSLYFVLYLLSNRVLL